MQAEVFDEVQIFNHGLVVRFRFHVLLLQNRRRAARIAGEKQQQIVFQIVARLVGNFQRPRLDFSVRQKIEARQTAVSRDVLILFANRFFQPVQLDVARLRGEFGGMDEIFFVRVQRLEQRRGETAGRTKPVPDGMSAIEVSSSARPSMSEQRKRLADDRMLQLAPRPPRVPAREYFTIKSGVKCFVQRDINVAVNRRRDEEAAEFFVIRRQIRAAAAEGDAKMVNAR